MSEHNDKRARKDRKHRVNDTVQGDGIQGEGDYQASRRYREDVAGFIATADVDALAHQAAPSSAKEARELALSEDRGRDRSKGDDAADPGIMYPGRKPDAGR
ncbi:MAG TPA: hypothetical protein VII41_05170 [Steroidobacteraceae bacterium]